MSEWELKCMFLSSFQRSLPILPKTAITSDHRKILVMIRQYILKWKKGHIPKEVGFNFT